MDWREGGGVATICGMAMVGAVAQPLDAHPFVAEPLEAEPLDAPTRSCALRPVVVPASLEALRGPVEGLIELPQRLFWSGAERVFDLSDPDRLLEMYEVVFDAARTEADLAEYINGETLARVWPDLTVAPRVRRAWEAAHPALPPVAAAV
jgi:hypothetical protein